MKNIRAIITLALLSAVIFISSCMPDDPNTNKKELGPYYMGEFLWYVYFDKGTEWVYEGKNERGKTVYDTVRVMSSTLDTIRYDDGVEGNWKVTKHYFNNLMFSTRFGSIKHELPNPGVLYGTSQYFDRFSITRTVWGEGEIRCFFVETEDYKISDQTTYEGLQNGIEAGGKTYDNVAVFYVESDPSWDKWNAWPARYYWAKNVGIIKRVQLDKNKGENAWELVSYKVNQ